MTELTRWFRLTKKIAKYVHNSHYNYIKLSYELEIQKVGEILQQGAILTLSHFYSVTMLTPHCRPNLSDIVIRYVTTIRALGRFTKPLFVRIIKDHL